MLPLRHLSEREAVYNLRFKLLNTLLVNSDSAEWKQEESNRRLAGGVDRFALAPDPDQHWATSAFKSLVDGIFTLAQARKTTDTWSEVVSLCRTAIALGQESIVHPDFKLVHLALKLDSGVASRAPSLIELGVKVAYHRFMYGSILEGKQRAQPRE